MNRRRFLGLAVRSTAVAIGAVVGLSKFGGTSRREKSFTGIEFRVQDERITACEITYDQKTWISVPVRESVYTGDYVAAQLRPAASGDDVIGIALHSAAPGEEVEILVLGGPQEAARMVRTKNLISMGRTHYGT